MRSAFMALTCLLPSLATAAEQWAIVSDESQIVFTYTLFGEEAEGRFTEFSGTGTFIAERPEATRFVLEIEANSLDLGAPLVSAFALSAEWFDAANYPDARYRLSRLTLDEAGLATALGDITIKGKLSIVEIPLLVEIGDRQARARGSVSFDRLDFGVGVGPSTLLVDLARQVDVSFDLIARPLEEPVP